MVTNSAVTDGDISVQRGKKKKVAVDLESLHREAHVAISWSVFKDLPFDVIHVITRNYAFT
jgi:hypothetical protein